MNLRFINILYAILMVESHGIIFMKIVHTPTGNPWKYFHAPRISYDI
jgi:hypothetical protein